MSLQDNKNALFGKGSASTNKNNEKKSTTTTPAAAPTTTPATTTKAVAKGISPELKSRKMNEAREYEERADKFLKTSIFQWSPDHVAAASSLDAAGAAYKVAEEYNSAITAFLRAADSHEACSSYAAAASSLGNVAEITKKLGYDSQTADTYLRIAKYAGLRGELARYGEFTCKAAQQLENSDPEKAKKLFLDGLSHLCPEEEAEKAPAIGPEYANSALKFFLKVRSTAKNIPSNRFTIPVEEIISFINRLILLNEANGMAATPCRLRVIITLLQLEQGDVIAADRTFLDHLSNSAYLKSRECQLAEEFIMAFKQMDIDMLDAAQRSDQLTHFDRDVQMIARSLSLLSDHNAPPVTNTTIRGGGGGGGGGVMVTESIYSFHKRSSGGDEKEENGDEEDENSERKDDHKGGEGGLGVVSGGGGDEEEDFDALIGEVSIPPQQAHVDEDEIDLT